MEDRSRNADEGIDRALDELLAHLAERLHIDPLGNQVVVDQFAKEIEIGLRRRREAGLDFLEAHLHEEIPEAQFLFRAHRIDERLVAVA